MNRLDIAAVAVGLGALGFAIVLMLSPTIAVSLIQPILAAILGGAGLIGLLTALPRSRNK